MSCSSHTVCATHSVRNAGSSV